jgi:hypothetical protein
MAHDRTIAFPEYQEGLRRELAQPIAHGHQLRYAPRTPVCPDLASQQFLRALWPARLVTTRLGPLDVCRRTADRARHHMSALRVDRFPAEESSGKAAHDTAHQRLLEAEQVGDLILGMNLRAAQSVAHTQDGPIALRQLVEHRGRQGVQMCGQCDRRWGTSFIDPLLAVTND